MSVPPQNGHGFSSSTWRARSSVPVSVMGHLCGGDLFEKGFGRRQRLVRSSRVSRSRSFIQAVGSGSYPLPSPLAPQVSADFCGFIGGHELHPIIPDSPAASRDTPFLPGSVFADQLAARRFSLDSPFADFPLVAPTVAGRRVKRVAHARFTYPRITHSTPPDAAAPLQQRRTRSASRSRWTARARPTRTAAGQARAPRHSRLPARHLR